LSGGGGGNSHCCKPYHVGYGFSFALRYGNLSSDPSEDFQDNGSSDSDSSKLAANSSLSFEDLRFQYDLIGKLLHEVAAVCDGYSSWCCLCSHLQSRIRSCLLTGNDGSSSIFSLSDCLFITDQISKVSWLLDIQCCEDDRSSGNPFATNFSLVDSTLMCDPPSNYSVSLYSYPISSRSPFSCAKPSGFVRKQPSVTEMVVSLKLPLTYKGSIGEQFELFSYKNCSFRKLFAEYVDYSNFVSADLANYADDLLYCYPNTLAENSWSPPVLYSSSSSNQFLYKASFQIYAAMKPVSLLFLCIFVLFVFILSWILFVRVHTKFFSVRKESFRDEEVSPLLGNSENPSSCSYNSF
jgi:hypothetical protein